MGRQKPVCLILLALVITDPGCGRIGFDQGAINGDDTSIDTGDDSSIVDRGTGGGTSNDLDTATDTETDTVQLPDTEGEAGPCPGDEDMDEDGVCDAVDLELQTTLSDALLPVASLDEHILFTVRSDGNAIAAWDISTPEYATDPVWIAEAGIPMNEEILRLVALSDGRLATASGMDGSGNTRILRVFSFNGTAFTVEEHIDTVSARIYDIVYDPATDRLYWSNFDSATSVYYFVLGGTPMDFMGWGTPFGFYAEQGTYGLLLDENYLYRLRSQMDVVDLSTQEVVYSLPLDGSHVSSDQGNVAKHGDYLFFIERWFAPLDFWVVDVSNPTQASLIASLVISQSANHSITSFALRADGNVAVAAAGGIGLYAIDLSSLPVTVSQIELLDSDELAGRVPAGKIDCTSRCCYADSTSGEIIVLCP